MIDLIIEPRIEKTPEEFFGPGFMGYSIALDGYVKGKPEFRKTKEGPKLNLNHHEGVDRLGTRSTCGQVKMAIKGELFDTFTMAGEPHARVFVNDCDPDVCLSIWLLQNSERITGIKSEPLLSRLVEVTDLLDTTAGAYPIAPSTNVRRELGWIYQPYSTARLDGRVSQMKIGEMQNVIETVCHRISEYSFGRGEKIRLDTRYEVLGGNSFWKLVKEIGFDARSQMFIDGMRAFISVRERGNGFTDYTYGLMSTFIGISLPGFYSFLNKIEGLQDNTPNCHGGGDIIGGSPRITGSKLSYKEIENLFNQYLVNSSG